MPVPKELEISQSQVVGGRKENTGEAQSFTIMEEGGVLTQELAGDFPIIDTKLTLNKGLGTLANPVSQGDFIINLEPGHGCVDGDTLVLVEGETGFEGTVTNVNVNAITVDSLVNSNYTTSAFVIKTVGNLIGNTSGATQSSPIIFDLQAQANQIIEITRIIFYIQGTTQMDDSKFGGGAALTNGLLLRHKRGSEFANIFNIKTNGDFRAEMFNVEINEKTGGGEHSLGARRTFGGIGNNGTIVRLDGNEGDSIELVAQDDVATAGTIFRAIVQGRFKTVTP